MQSVNIDLGSAAQLVIGCKAALQDYRSDEMWSKLYSYAVSIAEKHNIDINVADGHRRKRPQRQLDDCVIYESVGSREEVTTSQEFKQKLYFPVLDVFLAEIERRFDDKNIDIMKAIQACHPDSEAFLCINALQPLIENYALDKDAIESECFMEKLLCHQHCLLSVMCSCSFIHCKLLSLILLSLFELL